MSTRYLRKVYGNDGILKENREDLGDFEGPPISESKLFNVFDLLNENSENEERGQESTAGDDFESQSSKRKKKKKKKKKADHAKNCDVAKEEEEEVEPTDEIERTVREVNKLLGEPQPGSSKDEVDQPVKRSKELILSIQHKQLNPYNELKRICGSKIVQAEQSKRRNRGRTGYTKKTHLVVPRDNWSPIGKSGLSMSIDTGIEAENGVTYFVFVHGSSYREIQKKFFDAVDSQNPENIINIMNAHTYHVDTLLQTSELCKLNEDLQMSAELIERAVYCMECALHPSFNIATGKCRLSYKKQANRAFYITLFKHMMFVGGRAFYRTSLEFCKFIMTLDPVSDPLAITLAIDFYALRSREYEWFIDFCELWDEPRNLMQLPNIAFSLALAHFHCNEHEVADELLQNALFMFPGVLLPLLDKCGVQTDLKVLGHDYFNSKAKSTTSAGLEKLQDLYVARSYHLWKEPEVLLFLENATHNVLRRVDAGDEYAKFCSNKRTLRYQGQPPRSVLRHIVLSDFKDVTISHPAIRDSGPIFSYDPLPPADSVDIYQRQRTVQRPAQANSNLFSLFMSSLYTDLAGNIPNIALNGFELYEGEEDISDDEID
ncbi:transcription factor 25 [Venturia canescens]|uniref:transcription factor 25 n=1 Tax=Venturia canescens TaxID=32260 RepID=UPI001C9BF81C|nr:transcription factor 25 [Venturia canescens]XP_043286244.1 transcription factor 25 [Venturia canescens]